MRSPPSSAAAAVVELKRGPWTAEEDKLLSDYIKKEGEGKWRTLPTRAGLLRCGKSCRLRWMNYLRPSVKRGHITSDEEDLIIRLHRLSKKLMSHGIDPKTHKPRLTIAKPPNPDSCGVDDILLLDSSTETLLPTSNDERTSCNIEAAALQEKGSHCPDDTFSEFVNSFINDDMFESHQQEKKTTAS